MSSDVSKSQARSWLGEQTRHENSFLKTAAPNESDVDITIIYYLQSNKGDDSVMIMIKSKIAEKIWEKSEIVIDGDSSEMAMGQKRTCAPKEVLFDPKPYQITTKKRPG